MHRFILPRLIVLVFSLLCSSLALANAGLMYFVRGEVSAIDAQGNTRKLGKGDSFSAGDTINTGKGALAQLKFTDGALVSLQPNSSFRVDEYSYDGKTDGSEKGNFSLLQGGMRTITGAVGRQNRNNYKVNAVIATIGIRGTEYTAQLDDPKETLLVHTGEGLVEVCNSAGCILLAGGETGRVSSNREPRRTEYRPQLPPPGLGEGNEENTYHSGEQRNAQGALAAIPSSANHPQPPATAPMPDGNDYTLAYYYSATPFTADNNDVSFDASGTPENINITATNASLTPIDTVGSQNTHGILSWGRWSEADLTDLASGSTSAMTDAHFIVGKPTSSTELASLGTLTATYTLLPGSTTLTGNMGGTGSLTSASLDVSFSGGTIGWTQLYLSGTTPYGTFSNLHASGNNSPNANFSGGPGDSNLTYIGFVSGSSANHAGVLFQFQQGATASETFTGAAAFQR